ELRTVFKIKSGAGMVLAFNKGISHLDKLLANNAERIHLLEDALWKNENSLSESKDYSLEPLLKNISEFLVNNSESLVKMPELNEEKTKLLSHVEAKKSLSAANTSDDASSSAGSSGSTQQIAGPICSNSPVPARLTRKEERILQQARNV